jgi:hypothetical protein
MSAREWPAVPMPGRTVRLPLGCPAQLVELSGYDGAGRLVAMWWTPLGDELMFSDGTITATGHYRGWLAFCAHPLTRLFLNPYELGSSEHEAEHWLLVDRHLATLDIGLSHATQPSELHALTAELSPGEAAALLQQALEGHAAREPAKTPEQARKRHPRPVRARAGAPQRARGGSRRGDADRHRAARAPRSPLAAPQGRNRLASGAF